MYEVCWCMRSNNNNGNTDIQLLNYIIMKVQIIISQVELSSARTGHNSRGVFLGGYCISMTGPVTRALDGVTVHTEQRIHLEAHH